MWEDARLAPSRRVVPHGNTAGHVHTLVRSAAVNTLWLVMDTVFLLY